MRHQPERLLRSRRSGLLSGVCQTCAAGQASPERQRRNGPAGFPVGLLLRRMERSASRESPSLCPRAGPLLRSRPFDFRTRIEEAAAERPPPCRLCPQCGQLQGAAGLPPSAAAGGRHPNTSPCFNAFLHAASAVGSRFCSKGVSLCRCTCSGVFWQQSSPSSAGFAGQLTKKEPAKAGSSMAVESEGLREIFRSMSDLLIGKISRKKSGGLNGHGKKKKPSELQQFQGFGGDCWTRTSDLLRVKQAL